MPIGFEIFYLPKKRRKVLDSELHCFFLSSLGELRLNNWGNLRIRETVIFILLVRRCIFIYYTLQKNTGSICLGDYLSNRGWKMTALELLNQYEQINLTRRLRVAVGLEGFGAKFTF